MVYGTPEFEFACTLLVQYHYVPNDMYLDQAQAFADAIRDGRPSPVDGVEGMRGVAIERAVLDAGASGEIVWL